MSGADKSQPGPFGITLILNLGVFLSPVFDRRGNRLLRASGSSGKRYRGEWLTQPGAGAAVSVSSSYGLGVEVTGEDQWAEVISRGVAI
jgi:hypothetical protein